MREPAQQRRPDPQSRPRGCTCSKLRRIARRISALYDQRLAAAGVTVTQYSLLTQLRASPGITLTQLAEAMDMDRTSLTRTLRPLQRAGWVSVLPGADARRREIRLTPSGQLCWQAAKPLWQRAQEQVNEVIGASEVNHLHALLDAYVARFRAPPEGEE